MTPICHITGSEDDAANMLRFVRAPDGVLTPDLAGKLPAGAPDGEFWTGNRHALVGRLVAQENAPEDLPRRVEMLMRRQMAGLLGLARKAGHLVAGFTKVEAALKAGQVHLLVSASDGAADGRQKLQAKARAQNIAMIDVLHSDELAMALGRENVIHAGLIDADWADNLAREGRRLTAYLGL